MTEARGDLNKLSVLVSRKSRSKVLLSFIFVSVLVYFLINDNVFLPIQTNAPIVTLSRSDVPEELIPIVGPTSRQASYESEWITDDTPHAGFLAMDNQIEPFDEQRLTSDVNIPLQLISEKQVVQVIEKAVQPQPETPKPVLAAVVQHVVPLVEIQGPAKVEKPILQVVEKPMESLEKINKVYRAETLTEWHDTQMSHAMQAMNAGRNEEAIQLLQKILAKIPTASTASENLATLFLSTGDFDATTKVVDRALVYSPRNVPLLTIKARMSLELGNAEKAIKYLESAHPSLDKFPDFYSTKAAALQAAGRFKEAELLYRTLLQLDQNNGQYWLGYAMALESNHDESRSKEAYARASQVAESNSAVRSYAENHLQNLQG